VTEFLEDDHFILSGKKGVETAGPGAVPAVGASILVDDLVSLGYENLTVLDISGSALSKAQERLGDAAPNVNWIEADVTAVRLPRHAYDIWHDRAVFHFLTRPEERQAYVQAIMHAVRPGGHVIIATFAEDGPQECSGLPAVRYSPDSLHGEFGSPFTLLGHEREEHHTPSGAVQKFLYCYCRKQDA
jgi:SAM-dependent methyltransferase